MPNDPLLNATCTACGCLCDDIALSVENNRIVAARNTCPLGSDWFLADHSEGDFAHATIEGMPASLDNAIERAVEILHAAKSPLILGLTQTNMETQSLAVALADRIGATIDPAHSAMAIPRIVASQKVGFVSATLGEVKNRADVIVFWGVDPETSHPRHFERYSVESIGRFLSQKRTIVVVDSTETATSAKADHFLDINAAAWGESLVILRSLVLGIDVPHADSQWKSLATILKSARYGAFFFGTNLGQAQGGSAVVEASLTLVRDLNKSTRFVALTLGGPGNPAGIESVLTSQAGSPVAIDFSAGFPRFLPEEATAEVRLSNQETDAALIVADDPQTFLSPAAMARLSRIPTIRIAPDATKNGWHPTVAIASATDGIHTRGTVTRSDGITLPLRPALTTALPTHHHILASLLRAMTTTTSKVTAS